MDPHTVSRIKHLVRRRASLAIGTWVTTVVMLAIGLLMLLPFFWMISTSFKSPGEVFVFPIQWIPETFRLDHHQAVWVGEQSFVHYYYNSVKISVISTAGAVFLSALAAYGFARTSFLGRDIMFFLYLSIMMIPPQILFVPKFMMFNWLGIYNNHLALILPGMFTIFGVFLIRQFFMSIPHEISEAAFIDGAGHVRIFWQIIVPLAKPALATFAILDFSWNWNDYENALIFLIDKQLYTIPLGLQNYILEHNINYNGMMAAASAGILPIIILFLFTQRYIIQGVAQSAVKG
ncbi:carbohydrate ABC transporter permease [Paenibacillus soyae]|uniref:Carbohydrate ABC transporter permease n=1 Tax=Paenibacillus soyae TaxID=2969249 RepID=A0A9X2MS86_9BACL|nr:carbohydrate ABC transporter permease [Paenibacillus soyae]MCR2805425.1 carbohydrate ABC transporter permease [Paenibacillus soyae]